MGWNKEMIADVYTEPLLLPKTVTCSCCKTDYKKTTKDTIMCLDGNFWFNCECGSTLIHRVNKKKVGQNDTD